MIKAHICVFYGEILVVLQKRKDYSVFIADNLTGMCLNIMKNIAFYSNQTNNFG